MDEELTMFEDYPPIARRTPKMARDDCCDAWAEFVDRTEGDGHRVWSFCHRWGHRRTPFSIEALAEIADTTHLHAEACILSTVEMGWIAPIQPEYYQRVPDRLWAGRLTKER